MTHPLLHALAPVANAIGASLVEPHEFERGDVPLVWEGEVVGGFRQLGLHDALDRLTGASGGYTASYEYDEAGNIETKDEGGVLYTLGYTDPQHVHAPKVVNGTVYEYDLNGNLVSDGGRVIDWNAENRPVAVSALTV